MKTLIVEDSRLARQEILHLLKDIPEIEIVGEAENADKAIELIATKSPDLLLLDINLPGKNGFELLQELESSPHVIFITAYDEYALKAFEINALDYIQKPVKKERLVAALEKVKSKASSELSTPNTEKLLGSEDQVFVKDGESCWFVKLSTVRYLEIVGSYTKIHFESESPTIPKTLNYMEARLDPKLFFRANRQQILNLRFIDKVEPWFSGSLKITLSSGEEIEVSRRQATRFKELLSF